MIADLSKDTSRERLSIIQDYSLMQKTT